MTVTQNLLIAFQYDTATAAIKRVEFTAKEKVEEKSAEPAGGRARGGRAASPLTDKPLPLIITV